MKIVVDTPLGRVISADMGKTRDELKEFIENCVGRSRYLSLVTRGGVVILPESILNNSIIRLEE